MAVFAFSKQERWKKCGSNRSMKGEVFDLWLCTGGDSDLMFESCMFDCGLVRFWMDFTTLRCL